MVLNTLLHVSAFQNVIRDSDMNMCEKLKQDEILLKQYSACKNMESGH
jgi:hypothetical protein